jgi:chromate transporter
VCSSDLPVLASIDLPAFLIAAGALVAVLRFRAGILPVLAACALLGAAYALA